MSVTQKTKNEKMNKQISFRIDRDGVLFRLFTFSIKPEELMQDEPARVNVIKTLGGAYVEEWGRGSITMTIRGTTGYKERIGNNGMTDGFQEFKELRNDIYRYFLEPNGTMKQYLKETYDLMFYNWEDQEFYYIVPNKFSLLRSKNKPLLYQYDFSFTCIKPIIQSVKDSSDGATTESNIPAINTSMKVAANNTRVVLAFNY